MLRFFFVLVSSLSGVLYWQTLSLLDYLYAAKDYLDIGALNS